jgi:hypothetical protein
METALYCRVAHIGVDNMIVAKQEEKLLKYARENSFANCVLSIKSDNIHRKQGKKLGKP